jgi:glutamate--cysteine ligase
MDPARSGLLTDVVRDGEFSFRRWVDYLLDVPMMFYCIHDVFSPAYGRTFRSLMAEGLDGYLPTLEDWEMHLTSVFPEVRMKKYIEVRGADCVRPDLSLAVPALWKGLLYDTQSLEAAFQLARRIPAEDRDEVFHTSSTRRSRSSISGSPPASG